MKLSKETTTQQENFLTPSNKKTREFCNISCQSMNYSFLHFVNESNKSAEKMDSLIQSIHNICSSMLFGCSTPKAMQQVRANSILKTKQLKAVLNNIHHTNRKLKPDYESFTEPTGRKCNQIKFIQNTKRKSKCKPKRALSLSEITTLESDTKDSKIESNAIITHRFNQMMKLKKLKGEIKLNDQRKKYAINKTFEKLKEVPEGYFYRKEADTIKYTPYNSYNKENLYYKKNYNKNDQYLNKYDNNSNNNLHYSQCYTANAQSKAKRKILFPSSIEYSKSQRKMTTTSNNDYYNTQLSTQRGTNSDSTTITYNHPKSAIPNNRNQSRIKRTIDFRQLITLNSEIYKQNEELKRIIKEDSSKEKSKPKPPKEKLEIDELRRELKLDSLDSTIDENKIIILNAEKVSKNLDEKSKGFLSDVIKEMMFQDTILNKKFYDDCDYEKRIKSIKEKKEMQKVVDQMMGLKKKIKNVKAIIPVNEREKIIKMVQKTSANDWIDINQLKSSQRKCRVMTNIKPLIDLNKNKVRKKKMIFI